MLNKSHRLSATLFHFRPKLAYRWAFGICLLSVTDYNHKAIHNNKHFLDNFIITPSFRLLSSLGRLARCPYFGIIYTGAAGH